MTPRVRSAKQGRVGPQVEGIMTSPPGVAPHLDHLAPEKPAAGIDGHPGMTPACILVIVALIDLAVGFYHRHQIERRWEHLRQTSSPPLEAYQTYPIDKDAAIVCIVTSWTDARISWPRYPAINFRRNWSCAANEGAIWEGRFFPWRVRMSPRVWTVLLFGLLSASCFPGCQTLKPSKAPAGRPGQGVGTPVAVA